MILSGSCCRPGIYHVVVCRRAPQGAAVLQHTHLLHPPPGTQGSHIVPSERPWGTGAPCCFHPGCIWPSSIHTLVAHGAFAVSGSSDVAGQGRAGSEPRRRAPGLSLRAGAGPAVSTGGLAALSVGSCAQWPGGRMGLRASGELVCRSWAEAGGPAWGRMGSGGH